MKKKVVVLGSFVVDLMSRAPHLPAPGETVMGSVFRMGAGGKGFNQSVAAFKSGADVTLITKIGNDIFGKLATDTMEELGMETKHLYFSEEVETGTALILVGETEAQNSILVVPGACGTFTHKEIENIRPLIKDADYLLMQLEINMDAILQAADIAEEYGTKVIMNTAPVQPVSDDLYAKLYLVTPNEIEAEILTGVPVHTEADAQKAAEFFFEKGVQQVIITLGSRGVYIDTKTKQGMIPARTVDVVDSTGAGDAFNGGLLTALSEGKDLWEAAEFANTLASLSVQKLGTSGSMPWREEIDKELEK